MPHFGTIFIYEINNLKEDDVPVYVSENSGHVVSLLKEKKTSERTVVRMAETINRVLRAGGQCSFSEDPKRRSQPLLRRLL